MTAEDAAGNVRKLGVRRITCANATAGQPFGTLDTPGHGSTVTGLILNWGWALTPQPNIIPTDGSTIWVFLDGESVGHPLYNLYRPDVSTLFPDRRNTDGPVGLFHIDTTRLSNGLHSLAWSVTDDGGRIEGIGSRLFMVNNPFVSAAATVSPKESVPRRTAARSEGVSLRTGYNLSARLVPLQKDGTAFTATVSPMARLELHLPFSGSGLRGCVIRGDQCVALPAGSVLAKSQGIFYWQLDVAFLGLFELRFSDGETGDGVRVIVAVSGDGG